MSESFPNNMSDLLLGSSLHLASCVEILRTDSVAFRYTDHDHELVIGGNAYKPNGAYRMSAAEKRGGFRGGNAEFNGVFTDGDITHQDLVAGRFREAKITHLIIDYRYPWLGAFFSNVYWIESLTFDHEKWNAEISGLSSFLRKPVGDVYGRTCRHNLGDAGCKYNIDGDMVSKTVTLEYADQRYEKFRFAQSGGLGDGYYNFGRILWTSGDNAGIEAEVKTHENPGGGPQQNIVLAYPMPFTIDLNDGFNIWPGCSKTIETCLTKFNNVVNFGGFPTIPGIDRMLQGPDVAGRDEGLFAKFRDLFRGG
jgi:uncharacterized phage protein (TIGR02218 family)